MKKIIIIVILLLLSRGMAFSQYSETPNIHLKKPTLGQPARPVTDPNNYGNLINGNFDVLDTLSNGGTFTTPTLVNPAFFGTSTGSITIQNLVSPSLTSTGTLTTNDIVTKGPWVDVRAFQVKCDNSTDDTVNIQSALNLGGTILFPTNKTCLATSANLTLVSGTTIIIPRGTTLNLGSRRIAGQNANDVAIIGGGAIQSVAINTTDAFPPNWPYRGIVEFGSTTSTPIKNITIDGMEIYGDFSGTPAGTYNGKKEGISIVNVFNLHIKNNYIHNIWDEAINTNQGAGNGSVNGLSTQDIGQWIEKNTITNFNFDGISTQQTLIADAHITRNILYNGWTGFESFMGEINDNIVDGMQNSCLLWGGNNNNGNPVSYVNNTFRNCNILNLSWAVDIESVGMSGPLKFIGNTIQNVKSGGVAITNIKDLLAVGNSVTQMDQIGGGYSAFYLQNINKGFISGNILSNSLIGSPIGLNVGSTNSNLTLGLNYVDPSFFITYSINGTILSDVFPSQIQSTLAAGTTPAITMTSSVQFGTTSYSTLTTIAGPSRSGIYCSDCNTTSPCTSGGVGAFAFNKNGLSTGWNCPY